MLYRGMIQPVYNFLPERLAKSLAYKLSVTAVKPAAAPFTPSAP